MNLKKEYLEQIQRFRLMDDLFMSAVFDENVEAAELVLRVVLGRDDLSVESVISQREIRNLGGKSVRLDIVATDEDGKFYDIEVQRSDEGSDHRRARFNSALLDSKMLDSGGKYADLKDSYVIFITENDIEKMGWPLYRVERMIQGMDRPFGDGSHIVYVNGKYKGDDPVGRLVHDFNCMDADEMYYESLAKRVRYFKQDKGGQRNMSSCLDEWLETERKEIAANLWNCGVQDIAIIAEATHLSEETVREAVGEQIVTTA